MKTSLPFVAAGILLLGLSACAQAPAPSASAAAAAAVAHSIDGRETARGTFEGASNHVTTGHGSIFRSGGKWYVSLASDFTFDGAPDPKVALGNNGFVKDATLAPLSTNAGAQVYEIPATLDVGDFNEIWIWCEQFSVPLGVAKLTLT